MNFLEKLDFLMDRYELNKRTLSQKSKIPYTTIDGWYKKGYEGLKLTTLRKLNEYFNTTLDYWVVDEITDPNYGKSTGFKVDYDEMEHIKKYRSLDSFGQETVSYILDRELERTEQLGESQSKTQDDFNMEEREVIYLPELYSRFSAGTGEYALNSNYEKIPVPYNDLTSEANFIAVVSGDSMEPEYYNSDRVLVEAAPDVSVGEIGVWAVNGEQFIKKRGDGELLSLNPDYDNIELKEYDSIYCIGKVIGKLD